MARTELTPQDKEYKKIISSRLNDLLSRSGRKQIDITRSVGIPASTLTGYFKGTRLPSPKNVEKLAEYFNVEKSDIDPRFGRDPREDDLKTADLADDDTIFTFEGKPIPEQDLEYMKRLLRGGRK
ncbi:helix-turn-helix domain-containing protein [Limosilactobacillus mucosae]|jgi:transcriptional regulator with XRE-family HTH domain|uniref:helix-turn-helix domain-containing protein n=1 Tax=Limosilactobacillus mucosae TaxID=97478 RepID=UPI00087F6805|nr:helix-turn-helix transcriptional regulator [Limosilactobacillus mucosae]SDN11489.1 Helix-turn-helix [Limosilactobacillus mucosae]SEK62034.1 Helix-turn-helix [Limosilactobacillus mucosae]SFK02168.1 Helix-turn-helix [Limosilactobacillus mucosae]